MQDEMTWKEETERTAWKKSESREKKTGRDPELQYCWDEGE